MNRLTKKIISYKTECKEMQTCLNKLGKLEDAEEKYGVDLTKVAVRVNKVKYKGKVYKALLFNVEKENE